MMVSIDLGYFAAGFIAAIGGYGFMKGRDGWGWWLFVALLVIAGTQSA